jgi:hypothetical protein
MTNRKTLTLLVGLIAFPWIAQVQQNQQPQTQPSQATIASCDDANKPQNSGPAQNEAGRIGKRIFSKILKNVSPSIVHTTKGTVQPIDITQTAAETEAQKEREKQEHEKYCAALKEAAKKASPPAPTAKVIEACPPNTTRATGTAYCLKPDNTLVDVLHITVPTDPPTSSPATSTPAPPGSAVPATAQQ